MYVLYCIALYCIVLHCIVLHCIVKIGIKKIGKLLSSCIVPLSHSWISPSPLLRGEAQVAAKASESRPAEPRRRGKRPYLDDAVLQVVFFGLV